MQIFLTILSIIGKIILILLSVIAILIAAILFYPITYDVSGNFKGTEKPECVLKVHWLFRLIYFRLDYDKIGLKMILRIVGIPVWRKPSDEAKEQSAENEDAAKEDDAAENSKDSSVESSIKKKKNHKKKKKGKKSSSKKELLKKIWTEITDKRNQSALKHALAEVKKLVFRYSPKVFSADMTFGTNDPALTGKIVGVMSMFPFIYGKHSSIIPDFGADAFYADGTLKVQGRIQLIFAVAVAVALVRDRDMRRLIKRIKRLL